MRRTLLALLASFVLTGVAHAQQSQNPGGAGAYNQDLGPVISNSARAPGTVTTAQQTNQGALGLLCVYYASAVTGSPSVVVDVETYNPQSATWYPIGKTDAITLVSTPVHLYVYPERIVTDSPSASSPWHLPYYWRVGQTISGSGSVTGNISCQYLR